MASSDVPSSSWSALAIACRKLTYLKANVWAHGLSRLVYWETCITHYERIVLYICSGASDLISATLCLYCSKTNVARLQKVRAEDWRHLWRGRALQRHGVLAACATAPFCLWWILSQCILRLKNRIRHIGIRCLSDFLCLLGLGIWHFQAICFDFTCVFFFAKIVYMYIYVDIKSIFMHVFINILIYLHIYNGLK